MKLSKTSNKNAAHLQSILDKLERVDTFIKADETMFARKSSGTTTLDFQDANGQYWQAMNKQIGSELQLLEHAITNLQNHIKQTL